jgi:hypothetical protein
MHDPSRRPRQHLDVRHVGGERAAHRRDELRRERRQRGARVAEAIGGWRRLGDDLDGTQLERADRHRGPRSGVRADDDDGARRFRHDVADRAQPIELRHLEVEGDDVRLVQVNFADRIQPVARGRHDPELAGVRIAAAEHVDQNATHERAVVGDDDGWPRRPVR